MKRIFGFLIAAVALAGAIGGVIAVNSIGDGSRDETGQLTLQITDAPEDFENVFVTITEVRVHRGVEENVENEAPSENWITVTDNTQTYDLLALENVKKFLGSTELETGVYTQIRLELEDASLVVNGEEHSLTVPSGSVKLVRSFEIEDNQTTTLTLDFDVEKSVHSTGQGRYIMRPTIRVISE